MQKHRSRFPQVNLVDTCSDIQRCLRLNDLDEIGDGTHYLDFHMLGLFSFNSWTVQQGVDWWMEFLLELGVLPDEVTIHPDCPHWRKLYDRYSVRIRLDEECQWTDGSIGGYCTEFYLQGVEIGNIVNPLGTGLDCGFGSERIQHLLDHSRGIHGPPPTRQQVVFRTVQVLIDQGVTPSNLRQGYVLRRLIREQIRDDHPTLDHPLVDNEKRRRQKILLGMPRLRQKHSGKSLDWFWETHGIHPDDWEG